jgi:spore maturation protein CgeB
MKKILIIDTYYPEMLNSLSTSLKNDLKLRDNELIADSFFGTGLSYTHYLKELGHETTLLIANYSYLLNSRDKMTWKNFPWRFGSIISRLPLKPTAIKYSPIHKQIYDTALKMRPDAILTHDINFIPPWMSITLKSMGIKLIGEIASPLPPLRFFRNFDLILTSLPNIQKELFNQGINVKLFPLGFDPRILNKLEKARRDIDVSFVGSFSKSHTSTFELLKTVVDFVPRLQIYGPKGNSSKIIREFGSNYCGEAWGLDMFKIFGRSKVTLNRHSSIANGYSNNMRMFEATGMGSLLMTEGSSNISDYFEVGKEVLTYDTAINAGEKISVLLKNVDKISEIAGAGQLRTLKDHSYQNRATAFGYLLDSIL